MFDGTLCDIQGLLVGQVEDREARTGVTAVRCPAGTVGGACVRGAAPGTRETDLLRVGATVRGPNAVLLCGGSAFGLAAAEGAMRYLEGQGVGIDVGVCKVPIVPAAVIFDLAVGSALVRPTADMGYAAMERASSDLRQGAYGAGCGATVGKLVPGCVPHAGGVGSASMRLPSGITVAALSVVNAAGDVYHPHTGALRACGQVDGVPVSLEQAMQAGADAQSFLHRNTTIGIIATDAVLDKEMTNRLADIAHDGLARTVRPVHTDVDGDTIFALSTGSIPGDVQMLQLLAAAAEVFARAVYNAVDAS